MWSILMGLKILSGISSFGRCVWVSASFASREADLFIN